MIDRGPRRRGAGRPSPAWARTPSGLRSAAIPDDLLLVLRPYA
ncbi:hypothetical protein ACFY19_02995 [Streptosporangium saharense]